MATSDARTLATLLADLDDETLAALLETRTIAPTAALSDLYDLAEALLEAASVARGLERLPRSDVAALDGAVTDATPSGPALERLQSLALVDGDGRPYAAVVAAYAANARGHESAEHSADADEPEPAEHAAERAFTAVASLADVLQASLATPLGRIGSGALGAADRRRLVDLGAVDEPETADLFVEIAELAGLLAPHDRQIRTTVAGRDWLSTSTADRWCTVAGALRAALPPGLRTADGGWPPVSEWPGAHPFDPAWPKAAARWRKLFERWAIVGAAGTPSPWAEGLAIGAHADAGALRALLPPEVDRVFLQNDLTAIAPGPLAPEIDLRLRRMARRESRAQASTFRFTAETIADALTAGETAASLRVFLQQISLTGIPQPLAYEIDRCAERHGGVRIGVDPTGRTHITGLADLIAAIAVDQSLRPLGFVRDGDDLVTRSSPETAFWMLADARYPVIALGPEGAPRTVAREVISYPAPVQNTLDAYAALIARLRSARGTDSDAVWLGRELEQAVRDRAVVTVEVSLPDGTGRELTMELTGIGGGRLRGLDRGADVERTLPIASIRSIRPV